MIPPSSQPRVVALAEVAALIVVGVACSAKIDRFTVDRVVPTAMAVPDVGEVCALGAALDHALASVPRPNNPPERALVIAQTSASLCAEEVARAADLHAARLRRDLAPDRVSEALDARVAAERAWGLAAARAWRAWRTLDARYGPFDGETCPSVASRDEIVLLVGLVAGTNALLHDRSAGGPVGVPLDQLLTVGRLATCVDDAAWWHAPTALQAGAWATIPGSGPEGVDPWAELERAASLGDPTGVRIARALQIVVAANAGRRDVVGPALDAMRASEAAVPSSPEWALLDAYAHALALHQADLWWIEATGHRATSLAPPPAAQAAPAPSATDPFEADPFGEEASP
jgi:hypothetical protein